MIWAFSFIFQLNRAGYKMKSVANISILFEQGNSLATVNVFIHAFI